VVSVEEPYGRNLGFLDIRMRHTTNNKLNFAECLFQPAYCRFPLWHRDALLRADSEIGNVKQP
jgi:hypothetical protein